MQLFNAFLIWHCSSKTTYIVFSKPKNVLAFLNNFATMQISPKVHVSTSPNSPQNIQHSYVKFLDHDRLNDQTFCNFTIITDTCSFKVHKCLVGLASEFFKASMTIEMKENYQNAITVRNVSSDVMDYILDYIYGNEVALTVGNCCELFVASDFLQIPQLLASCRGYLNHTVVVDDITVISFWMLAERHGLDDLLRKCRNYIKKNFESLSSREEIKTMPFDVFKLYLNVKDESTVERCYFGLIISWIEFDKTKREEQFSALFKLVNLDKLDKSYISSKLLDNELIMKNPESLHQLMTSLKTHMDDDTPTSSLQTSQQLRKQLYSQGGNESTSQRSHSNEFVLVQLHSNEVSVRKYDVSPRLGHICRSFQEISNFPK